MPPSDYGPSILVTAFTLTTLSTVVVFLRLYCNAALIKRAGATDGFMFSALIVTWGIAVINYYQVKYGSGKHIHDDSSMDMLTGTLKSWYAFQLAYLIDLVLVKFSILFFYRSISDHRWFRVAIYSMMAIVGSFTFAMVFVNAFECPHPADAFTIEIIMMGLGSCRDLHSMYFAQASFNIASDLVIVAIPIPLLARLQMPRARRVALLGIFSVGFVAVLASILRLWALTIWASSTDVPYTGGPILLWTQIELNAAIISASFPALKALFTHTFGSARSRSGGSSDQGRYLKYGYGARSHKGAHGSGHKAHDGSITLKTMSLLKSGTNATSSAGVSSAGGHGLRMLDTGNGSDEQMFLDEPVGELVADSRRTSLDERRDRVSGLVVPQKAQTFADHDGIIRSVTVEQTTTKSGPGRPQYYRAHFIQ